MKRLQDDLGTIHLSKRDRSLALTEAGEIAPTYARRILAIARRLARHDAGNQFSRQHPHWLPAGFCRQLCRNSVDGVLGFCFSAGGQDNLSGAAGQLESGVPADAAIGVGYDCSASASEWDLFRGPKGRFRLGTGMRFMGKPI